MRILRFFIVSINFTEETEDVELIIILFFKWKVELIKWKIKTIRKTSGGND
jgi:hypothetical protein